MAINADVLSGVRNVTKRGVVRAVQLHCFCNGGFHTSPHVIWDLWRLHKHSSTLNVAGYANRTSDFCSTIVLSVIYRI